MEEKSVIKRILIAVIVVLIGAVCIAGFLALKHSHGGSWDVLLVFGIKCTSMSSFWRYINWSHDFSYYRYCRSYCTGGGSFLESCWICGQSGGKNYHNAMGQNIVCDFVIAASIFSDDD